MADGVTRGGTGGEVLARIKAPALRLYARPKVKNAVAKLVSRVRGAPYRTDTMELQYGVWAGVSSIHCAEGRQIGEENTEPKVLRESFPTDYRVSNLPGSRAGRRINLETLRSVMRGWSDAMDLVHATRSHFVQVLPPPSGRMPLFDTYVFAKCAVAQAAYLARRSRDPIADGEVPVVVANEVKLVAGIFMIPQHMLDVGAAPKSAEAVVRGADLYDYADENGVFISPSGHVCAGSQSKIVELLDLVVDGPSGSVEEPGAACAEALDRLGGVEAALPYGLAGLQLELTIALWRSELLRFALRSAKRLEAHDLLEYARRQVGPTPERERVLDHRSRQIAIVLQRLRSARIDWPARLFDAEALRDRIDAAGRDAATPRELRDRYEEFVDEALEEGLSQQREINRLLGRPTEIQFSRAAFEKQLCAFPR